MGYITKTLIIWPKLELYDLYKTLDGIIVLTLTTKRTREMECYWSDSELAN